MALVVVCPERRMLFSRLLTTPPRPICRSSCLRPQLGLPLPLRRLLPLAHNSPMFSRHNRRLKKKN